MTKVHIWREADHKRIGGKGWYYEVFKVGDDTDSGTLYGPLESRPTVESLDVDHATSVTVVTGRPEKYNDEDFLRKLHGITADLKYQLPYNVPMHVASQLLHIVWRMFFYDQETGRIEPDQSVNGGDLTADIYNWMVDNDLVPTESVALGEHVRTKLDPDSCPLTAAVRSLFAGVLIPRDADNPSVGLVRTAAAASIVGSWSPAKLSQASEEIAAEYHEAEDNFLNSKSPARLLGEAIGYPRL